MCTVYGKPASLKIFVSTFAAVAINFISTARMKMQIKSPATETPYQIRTTDFVSVTLQYPHDSYNIRQKKFQGLFKDKVEIKE